MKKAIFLDRDGTINKLKKEKYICNIEDVELIDWVKETLHKLKNKWYLLIVTTNQTWVGAWFYTKQQAEAVNNKIEEILWFKFDKIYSCYHHPDEWCICRKPATWMLEQAQKDFDIDFTNSYFVWDSEKDIIAWNKVWCKTIYVWKNKIKEKYGFFTNSFEKIAEFID